MRVKWVMGNDALMFSLAATGQSQHLERSVTISASELTVTYVLPKILAKIRKAEPGIKIQVVVANDVNDLKRREAEIGSEAFAQNKMILLRKK